MTRFIAINRKEESLWHIAERSEIIGPHSGKVLRVFFTPACGTRLRSCWGSTVVDGEVAPMLGRDRMCARCAKRMADAAALVEVTP